MHLNFREGEGIEENDFAENLDTLLISCIFPHMLSCFLSSTLNVWRISINFLTYSYIFSDLSEHLPENDESEEMVSHVTTQKVFLSVLPSDIWFHLIHD